MKNGYIHIDDNVFETLFAISEAEQNQGLMWKKWIPPTMTFVYSSKKINKFWMKNTPSPLDIVFCSDGRVSEICYGEPHSTSIIGSNKFSDMVIEVPFGTVKDSNIKIGSLVGILSIG